MSNAVSALSGASFDGIARIEEAGLKGMITFRGDLSDAKISKAVAAAAGVKMPAQRGCNTSETGGLAWMSPDELLIMTPHGEAGAMLETLAKSLKGQHYMAENVSDARAVFTVTGAKAREVLAKLAPADLSPEAFGMGEIRRTRMAQVAAAFWMHADDAFTIVCFRSSAQYMFDLLKVAAQEGSEVGVY